VHCTLHRSYIPRTQGAAGEKNEKKWRLHALELKQLELGGLEGGKAFLIGRLNAQYRRYGTNMQYILYTNTEHRSKPKPKPTTATRKFTK
jgi:hypothetical protein